MSRNYKFHNKLGTYFVSFATINWIDVFTRQHYFGILAESIKYCRKEKGMELYAYCFIPSHIHLLFRSANEDFSGLLRVILKNTLQKTIKSYRRKPSRK